MSEQLVPVADPGLEQQLLDAAGRIVESAKSQQQTNLSQECGLSRLTLNRLSRGKLGHVNTLLRLARHLDGQHGLSESLGQTEAADRQATAPENEAQETGEDRE